VDLVLALSAVQKGAALLAFTGLLAPLIGFALKRAVGGWGSYGGGPFSILREPPPRGGGGNAPLDPAIQAAEVRQMLAAKDERLRRRGEPGLDVEAEAQRLLAAAEAEAAAAADGDQELRAEVRQLVALRNERRRRAGLEPLDVEAETERELADLLRSR
jgi:hypothetical protein